jgi:tetratricopeptide (TPR) repeat protein
MSNMKYDKLMDEYRTAYQAKDYKQALKYIKKAIYANPRQYEPWAILGNLYLTELNKPDESIHALKRSLKYHPKNPTIFQIMASAIFKNSDYEECIEIIKKLLGIEPDNVVAWSLLDKIYVIQRKLQPVVDEIRDNTFKAYVKAAKDLIQSPTGSHFDDAIEKLEQALLIIPSNAEVLEDLAKYYYRQKNYAASLNCVKQLLVTKFDDVTLLNLMGYNQWNMKNLEDALGTFQNSLKLQKNQSTLLKDLQNLKEEVAKKYNSKGDSLFNLKNYLDAQKSYQTTLKYKQGDPYALKKIKEAQIQIQKDIDEIKNQETLALLHYLAEESKTNEELLLNELLLEIPAHTDIKDGNSLRLFLKQLILSKQLPALLTPTSLKFTTKTMGQSLKPLSKSALSNTQKQTTILRHSSLSIIILRDGKYLQNTNQYHFQVKVQNNEQYNINKIKILLYYPEEFLEIQNSNPLIIQQIPAHQLGEVIFTFNVKKSIFNGLIQTAVLYLNGRNELTTQKVSSFNIENITASMQPLQINPQKLAKILQKSQQFPTNQERFELDVEPQSAFEEIQKELQMLRFHIQKASNSVVGGKFNGFINATGQPTNMADPVLVEVNLVGNSGVMKTEVVIITSSSDLMVSEIMTHTVKNTIIMPRCPICDQVFPLSLYKDLKKGKEIVCEFCGSLYKE